MVVVLGLVRLVRDIDTSRLRLFRRARKARRHVRLDPEFSSLSRYPSKIFNLGCRSGGEDWYHLVERSTYVSHVSRLVTPVMDAEARVCSSRYGIHARRHLFIAGIMRISLAAPASSRFSLD